MSLNRVWPHTLGDGLVRADHVTGIDAHQTPAVSGKPSHWLVDVVLPAPFGSGVGGEWAITVLHRTLVQTTHHPGDDPTALARLLAQLDATNAAGTITTTVEDAPTSDEVAGLRTSVRFRFLSFPPLSPGQHIGPEYL